MSTFFHVSFVFFAHTFTDSDVMGNYVFEIIISSFYLCLVMKEELVYCIFLITICYAVLLLCVLFLDLIAVSFNGMQ